MTRDVSSVFWGSEPYILIPLWILITLKSKTYDIIFKMALLCHDDRWLGNYSHDHYLLLRRQVIPPASWMLAGDICSHLNFSFVTYVSVIFFPPAGKSVSTQKLGLPSQL